MKSPFFPIELPTVTLSNGLVIGNFNSPHPFTFEDGSVLPACSNEVAKATELNSEDTIEFNGVFYDVTKKFVMSAACKERLMNVMAFSMCDVIIVPLPVLMALKENKFPIWLFRTGFVVDRINKKLSINHFCG